MFCIPTIINGSIRPIDIDLSFENTNPIPIQGILSYANLKGAVVTVNHKVKIAPALSNNTVMTNKKLNTSGNDKSMLPVITAYKVNNNIDDGNSIPNSKNNTVLLCLNKFFICNNFKFIFYLVG